MVVLAPGALHGFQHHVSQDPNRELCSFLFSYIMSPRTRTVSYSVLRMQFLPEAVVGKFQTSGRSFHVLEKKKLEYLDLDTIDWILPLSLSMHANSNLHKTCGKKHEKIQQIQLTKFAVFVFEKDTSSS